MVSLYINVPYASFRKSYARSFAETYPLPPPATVYGMLLSLIGERFRRRHSEVRIAFAYKCRLDDKVCEGQCLPPVATTLRKLSRFKYGVGGKEGAKPDYVETVCGLEFLCWVDSSQESANRPLGDSGSNALGGLEDRIKQALESPEKINRYGVLSLGLSDDAVNDLHLCTKPEGKWHRLLPSETGSIELPIWVDHTGSAWTRWQRFELEQRGSAIIESPGTSDWEWIEIKDPRPS
ncbi:MAG TPA: type I-MYXAN CRISPR-associated protein Cas5/Cmx5/DevS [Pyrinomonadaceae bacterium]|nr:type I-MYXAN CRISPR-associated protein Cas5/Cmx5/DevS [Pyrinomonadaceae bacterium]